MAETAKEADLTSTFVESILTTSLTKTSSVFVFAFVASYFLFLRNKDLPPGPLKLPIIGNMWWVVLQRLRGKRIARAVKELADKYGDVIHLKFFKFNVIFFNGSDTILEAFVKRADVFSNRPQWLLEDVRTGYGIGFANGHEWKNIRRFALLALKGSYHYYAVSTIYPTITN